MAQRTLLCPSAECRGELDDKFVCSSCQTALADWTYSEIKDLRTTIDVLCSKGLFWDLSTSNLFLPLGDEALSMARISTEQPSGEGLRDFHNQVCRYCAYSPHKFKPDHARQVVDEVRHNPGLVPQVRMSAPHVWLQHDAEHDRLVWPNPAGPRSRLLPFGEGRHYYYTGPALKPTQTGAFQQWLQSFKCNSDEDRQVLRGWLLSTLVQPMLPPGKFPILLICADHPGAGKTATAELIGGILGSSINVGLKKGWNADIERRLLEPKLRLVLMDNLATKAHQAVIDAPDLARLATAVGHSTKALYRVGNADVPNYILWAATANRPALSSELTDRSAVVSILRDAPIQEAWESYWLGRRDELLADMLWEAIEAWKAHVPFEGKIPRGHRFPEWYRITARLLGRPPIMYPKHMFLTPPIQIALDALWSNSQITEDWVSVDDIEAVLAGPQFGVLKELGRQTSFTADSIEQEMLKFTTSHQLETRDGVLGIRRCERHGVQAKDS